MVRLKATFESLFEPMCALCGSLLVAIESSMRVCEEVSRNGTSVQGREESAHRHLENPCLRCFKVTVEVNLAIENDEKRVSRLVTCNGTRVLSPSLLTTISS